MSGGLFRDGGFWALSLPGWRGVTMSHGALLVIGKHWICE